LVKIGVSRCCFAKGLFGAISKEKGDIPKGFFGVGLRKLWVGRILNPFFWISDQDPKGLREEGKTPPTFVKALSC